ncbi:MAG: DNA/RNA non-specific endonuclease [Pseudomonadota bacterium]
MSENFEENVERVSRMPNAMKEQAAKALSEGHPLLREAGLEGALPSEALDSSKAQLESMGSNAAQLEAIIRMTNRPPLVVRNNRVELAGITLPGLGADIDTRIRAVEPKIASVGRIEFINHDMAWGGTGWVIAREGDGHLLIATNRHVAKIVARRTAFGSGAFLFDPFGGGRYGARIDFNEEIDAPDDQARLARIERFTYIAADTAADVALARIAVPSGFSIDPLPLAEDEGRDEERIAVIGYPARDSRNDSTHMERYFKGLYDVKRFSPGRLMMQPGATRLRHDATTLGGNSGSPVLSLDSGNVVGLHFAGRFAVSNSAVRVGTLKDVLSGAERSVPVGGADTGNDDTERRDGTREADDLAQRPGYAPSFLEHFDVPMPDASGVPGASLTEPSDAEACRPHELRYQHFGILFCQNYRSPVVAAANIDGANPVRIKRKRDRWFYDLRIPQEIQIGSEAYSDAGVDRGHMVKRETPNWGEDMDVAERANYDTFHLTNCSPQHGRFNRNTATWRGLEDYLIENSRTHGFRACIFTGPVLNEELDMIEETMLFLPREYWKVVVMPVEEEDGTIRPHASAYLLSQGQLIQQLLQDRGVTESTEGFVFGEYKTFQLPVRTLEGITGIDFGELRNFDPLDQDETESPVPVYIAVEHMEEIRL